MSISIKNVKGYRHFAFCALTVSALCALSLFVYPELLPDKSFADEPITPTPNITIGNSGALDLIIDPGEFDHTSEDIVVTTSNYTGYTMTIAPISGDATELINTSAPNITLPSISEELTADAFSDLSTAAYGLSLDDGGNYIPVENGTIISSVDGPTDEVTGAFTLTLGAKALSTTPAGIYARTFNLTAAANPAAWNVTYEKNLNGATDTIVNGTFPSAGEGALSSGNILTLSSKTPTRPGYKFLGWNEEADGSGATTYPANGTINLDPETTNQIILYAQWGCGDGYICYDPNGADGGLGTMEQTTLQSSAFAANSSQTLIAPNYSKTNYGFAGWNTAADGTGTNYGPNQTITMPASGGLQLYARWVASSGTLQGWSGCSTLNSNEVIALTDNRDSQVYTVAKLGDGKCWMTENLRLDVTDSSIAYTNNNTNHPASSFLYQIDAFNSGNPTWQACSAATSACDDQLSYSLSNITRTNTASRNAANQTSSWYAYGGMYNWFTATAGNGLYGLGTNNTNTAGDLCPNGWHLPTGSNNTTTDYKSLNAAINSNSTSVSTGLRVYPANFLYSGGYYDSNASSRGSGGGYWSSTVSNRYYAYGLSFSNSSVSPGSGGSSKCGGQAVRCLAGNPNYYIVYDANGGTGYSDPQSLGTTAPTGNTTTTLIASNFKRNGYGFAGWSRNPNADPNGVNATTEIFGPNAEYTVPSSTNFDSNKNLTLYAIWVPLAKDSSNNDLTFQTTNLLTVTLSDNSTLDSKSNGYVTALKDTRDNEVYAVAKLADGNYWMIENMRLDLSNNNTTITASNTNHPTAAFVTDINDNYKGKADDPNTTLWKTCTDRTAECIDQVSFSINNLNRESVTPITTVPKYDYQDYGWYSYGAYYNWYTATGGHGTYDKTNTVVDGDLCPSGWHLPQGGASNGARGGNTTGGLYYLVRLVHNSIVHNTATASADIRKYPNNFLYSSEASAVNHGLCGYYWSSTARANNEGQYLYLGSSSVSADSMSAGSKYDGVAVRCVVNNFETFTLAYDANGGSGNPASQTESSNTRSYSFTISSTEPTRTGLTFAGWATDQNATEQSTLYRAGATFTVYQPGTTTLYAVWVPEVIIHYNGNGATSGSMADQGVPSGTPKTLLPNTFTKTGFKFIGWTTTEGSNSVEYADSASYTAPSITPPGPLEVTLYAVWGRSGRIVYNINTDDPDANGTMTNQTGVYEYDQATLYASNFARPNYGFAGWSTDSDAYTHMTDNDQTNNPTIYGPIETITVPSLGEGSNLALTLYAVWVPAESNVTMQTFDPSASPYAGMGVGSVIALDDSRDNTNVYAVAKLKDGNWWMIENLRLDPAGKTLNSTNTNNPDSTFTSDIPAASSFETCQTNSSACDDQYSVGLGNLTGSNSYRTSNSQSYRWYSYGVMYNWHTATAGRGTYSMASGVTDGDICPAGWHLPYGGDNTGDKGGNTSGGFYYLNYKLNNNSNATDATASNNLRTYPNNFVYSGYYSDSNSFVRGSDGYYWSSVVRNSNYGYDLRFDSSNVYPGTNYGSKYMGFAVRCVVDGPHALTVSLNTGITSITVDDTTYYDGDTIPASRVNTTHAIEATTFDPGYEFLSWSLDFGTVTSTSSQSTTYVTGNNDGTLTATGKPITFDEAYDYAGKSRQGDHYLMQDMNPNICATVAPGQSGILTDVRDGTEYTVAKLGTQCWMSQNLRLNFASTEITSNNVSDLEAATNNPASGFWTSARGAASTVSPNFNGYEVIRYADNNLGGTSCPSGNCDIYGVYYNWYTATAGHGKQNMASGDTEGDLCPVNWHLPTGGTGNDTDSKILNNAINSGSTTDDSGLLAYPANFVYSGYFWGGDNGSGPKYGNDGRNEYGWLWTNTAMNNQKAHNIFISNKASGQAGVYPGDDSSSKYLGASVRCVAKAGTGLSGPLFGPSNDNPTDDPTDTPTDEPEEPEPTNNYTSTEQPAQTNPTTDNQSTSWTTPAYVSSPASTTTTSDASEPEESSEEDDAEEIENVDNEPSSAASDNVNTTVDVSENEESNAGINNDDILTAVAAVSLAGLAAASAASIIRGKKGTGTNPGSGETPESGAGSTPEDELSNYGENGFGQE